MNSLALFDTAGHPTREAIPRERARAMNAAIDAADRTAPGWPDRAFEFLRRYAETHSGLFTGEDVTAASLGVIDQPDTTRAWGALYPRAQREKLIVCVDGEGRRSNGSRCSRYRSLICNGGA